MVHHLSQTEKGELNHYGTVFFSKLGDGQRPAHAAPIVVAAVYLGIYIYIYIALPSSNQIKFI